MLTEQMRIPNHLILHVYIIVVKVAMIPMPSIMSPYKIIFNYMYVFICFRAEQSLRNKFSKALKLKMKLMSSNEMKRKTYLSTVILVSRGIIPADWCHCMFSTAFI
jgi:hypothetical protein